MVSTDVISASTAQIKAKASAAAKVKGYVSKTASLKINKTALPDGPRPAIVHSKRADFLKSINAGALRQAAQEMGLTIQFGADAKTWVTRNPQLADVLPAIRARADEITAAAKNAPAVDIDV